MVKGNSRQVIVVHSPDEKLVEQAILILKDGAVGTEGITDEALLKEAKHFINTPSKKGRSFGPLWAAAGAAATGLAWWLSMIW